MSELIGLDFETYGATDLPTHGLDRYASCETFRPLIGSVAYRHGNGFNAAGPPVRMHTFNFVSDRRASTSELRDMLIGKTVCAHNAGFEARVLDELGLCVPLDRFIDSAVVARAAGAGGSLEAAAPQLLDVEKMELGKSLIKLFSIPGEYQEKAGSPHFDPTIIEDHPREWLDFVRYCELDASLSLQIVERYLGYLTSSELGFQRITMEMSRNGWAVDLDLVREMQCRYLENQEQALADFRKMHGADDLNLNSLKQMKEWCEKRGVKATSFDEKHVAKYKAAVEKKILTMEPTPQRENYEAVYDLLHTKQVLGGSSLKKLQVILDTAHDGRLKDQYIHCGAGQTLRTTGRSVQMQNLKRLSTIADMSELEDEDSEWDNTKLAENLRQVFTATERDGALIVGDFSSVESRGLAYIARENYKLEAYRQGKDMYKVLAASPEMFGVPYDEVTKAQRQTGKVGELSCGYGAGAGAVQAFASNMGVSMTEAEALTLVTGWRAANPNIVNLWEKLDHLLKLVVDGGSMSTMGLPDGMHLVFEEITTPKSLQKQHPGAISIRLRVMLNGTRFLVRYFHGCHVRGRNICYYKPSDRKTGDLWKNHYVDQKTKQVRFYELYGGKLAGILTQSFCRELFFRSLQQVAIWAWQYSDSVTLVGQFHDEIVVDWRPGGRLDLEVSKQMLERMMSDPGSVVSFPLAAEIKHDYRYTK